MYDCIVSTTTPTLFLTAGELHAAWLVSYHGVIPLWQCADECMGVRRGGCPHYLITCNYPSLPVHINVRDDMVSIYVRLRK